MVRFHELEFRVRDLKKEITNNSDLFSNNESNKKTLFKLIDKNILNI